jgi:hypothetical protein
MATERSRILVLAALVVVLIVTLVKMWAGPPAAPGTSAPAPAASNRAGNSGGARPPQPGAAAPDGSGGVHLDSLNAERPKPESANRNLFRFKPKAPPPPPPAPVRPAAQAPPPPPSGPPPPPPLAPIPLKFIGVMGPESDKIAILSDGRNPPFLGKEGAIIEGRYRILKIGVESVELAYADGRGRQTIRLTGS